MAVDEGLEEVGATGAMTGTARNRRWVEPELKGYRSSASWRMVKCRFKLMYQSLWRGCEQGIWLRLSLAIWVYLWSLLHAIARFSDHFSALLQYAARVSSLAMGTQAVISSSDA